MLGDLEGAVAQAGDREARVAELWRRAARGDYGELLDARLAGVMEAGEEGRMRGLVGQLIGAVAIALDGVMTGEGEPMERSLAVSRLAQATTRIVGARERLVAKQLGERDALAAKSLIQMLEDLDRDAREEERVGGKSER